MPKLKTLKDGAKFILRKSGAYYTLQTLDKKKKAAIFTSTASGRTYTRNWNETYYCLV